MNDFVLLLLIGVVYLIIKNYLVQSTPIYNAGFINMVCITNIIVVVICVDIVVVILIKSIIKIIGITSNSRYAKAFFGWLRRCVLLLLYKIPPNCPLLLENTLIIFRI